MFKQAILGGAVLLASCDADEPRNVAAPITMNATAPVTVATTTPPVPTPIPSPKPTPPPAIDKAALGGAWAEVQYGCDGDGALFVNDDGTWHRNAYSGPWTLEGNVLKLRLTHEEDDEGNRNTLAKPVTEHWTVVSLGKNRMTARNPHGGTEHYMRCR